MITYKKQITIWLCTINPVSIHCKSIVHDLSHYHYPSLFIIISPFRTGQEIRKKKKTEKHNGQTNCGAFWYGVIHFKSVINPFLSLTTCKFIMFSTIIIHYFHDYYYSTINPLGIQYKSVECLIYSTRIIWSPYCLICPKKKMEIKSIPGEFKPYYIWFFVYPHLW